MALELSNTNDIREFLALLHKNAKHPRLEKDDRRSHDIVVAIYGTNNDRIDSVIYISRCYDEMVAWYESYAKKGEAVVSWDICGGGKTVNELEGWFKGKKLDLWSIDKPLKTKASASEVQDKKERIAEPTL